MCVDNMRNIVIKELDQTYIEDLEIEIVERKGIGHPDSISDGIAQAVSNALCDMYQSELGEGNILHHNTDEVQITAGDSNPDWEGGYLRKPIEILLTGRGVSEYEDPETHEVIKFPIERVAIKAAKDFLKENIINLDIVLDTVIVCKIGRGSGDLVDVFDRDPEAIPKSNDTSFGVGFAPLSEVEQLVLATEELLNSKEFKKEHPAVGEDIKVMGLREGDEINLTIACAMVSKYLKNREEYIEVRESLKGIVEDLAPKYTKRSVTVDVNTGDDDSVEDKSGYYLTVTGTSAEMGDDGSVGRGNRANGLITPCRPMSMEATSGKNPVNHVGKIYNVLANKMANDVVNEVDGIKQMHIMLLTQIGSPISEPTASIQVITEDGVELSDIEDEITKVINRDLDNIRDITKLVIEGKARTF